MMTATQMMTATPNDAWLRHVIMANIASLRNEVEQHHFERSEKHHIAAGDASFDDIQDYASIYLRKCDIMKLMILWILFFCLQEQKWRSPFVVLCFCKMRRKGAYREIRTFTKKMYERDSLFYLQIRYFMV